jgi:hypothetical protein
MLHQQQARFTPSVARFFGGLGAFQMIFYFSKYCQGFRLVFAQEAVGYEPVTKSSGGEFARKVRIISQGLYAISVMRVLLNPFRYKFYAIQLFSHKLLRRLMFVPLIILFVVTPFLWNYGLFFQLTMLVQIGFYGLALLGMFLQVIHPSK